MSIPFDPDRALAYRMQAESSGTELVFDRIFTLLSSNHKRVCCVCGGGLKGGDLARVRFEIRRKPAPAKSRLLYGCGLCCAAMAKAAEDGGRAAEERKATSVQERRRA